MVARGKTPGERGCGAGFRYYDQKALNLMPLPYRVDNAPCWRWVGKPGKDTKHEHEAST
jgi:hypothetical protein